MATIRIEYLRGGEWRLRGEGESDATAEQVAALLPDYAFQYPHRAFLDGVLVGECQPKKARRS